MAHKILFFYGSAGGGSKNWRGSSACPHFLGWSGRLVEVPPTRRRALANVSPWKQFGGGREERAWFRHRSV